jgi:hypothetical protein
MSLPPDPSDERPPGRTPTRRLLKRFLAVSSAAAGLVLLTSAGNAWAVHGRGTTVSATVAADGNAKVVLDQRTAHLCTVGQPSGFGSVTLYALDAPGGNRTAVASGNGQAMCRRTAGSFVETRAEIAIPMAGLADGWYVVRHEGGNKVSDIVNVHEGNSETLWSSEAQFRKTTGTASGSPGFGVDLPFAASIGFPYSQNLVASDPDGGTVTTRSLCCNADNPDYAVTYDVIDVGAGGAVAGNQVVIPSTVTSDLSNGEYLEFKVRVTDDDGEYSDLDMVLSPTNNVPPALQPPAQTTVALDGGTSTTIPLSAGDPDPGQTITFSLSGQPSWITLNQTPGNPATGTITVSPPPTVTGTFVVNVNATDSDPSLQATSSYALTFQVEGVPDMPTNLALTQGDRQVTATWDPPADTTTAVTGYRVEHRPVGSSAAFTVTPATTSPAVITGLTNGTLYEVRVVPVGAKGDGIPATGVTSPFTAPGTVRDLAVRSSLTEGAVSWQPPASDGGSPITGYLIEHRATGAESWIASGETTATAVALTDLVRGASYEVRVRALNAAGRGEWEAATFRTVGLPSSGSSTVVVIRNGEPVDAPLYTGPTAGDLVSVAGTPTGDGSWVTTAEGHVYTAGDAGFHGSLAGQRLNAPITSITPSLTGDGYFLVAADGGVFAFGDALYHGSMGGQPLNQPVQGIIPSCTGDGYYLVALDGGVFAFGDARFLGSMGGSSLNKGMLGIVPNCDLGGYWTFAADGGVFTFGDNEFFGSLGDDPPPAGVAAMAATPAYDGYWLIDGDGNAYAFGGASED